MIIENIHYNTRVPAKIFSYPVYTLFEEFMIIGESIYLSVQKYPGLNILAIGQPLSTFNSISNEIAKENIFI
jgi:hypothetical protein